MLILLEAYLSYNLDIFMRMLIMNLMFNFNIFIHFTVFFLQVVPIATREKAKNGEKFYSFLTYHSVFTSKTNWVCKLYMSDVIFIF